MIAAILLALAGCFEFERRSGFGKLSAKAKRMIGIVYAAAAVYCAVAYYHSAWLNPNRILSVIFQPIQKWLIVP